MIAETIKFVLSNVSTIMFVMAIIIASLTRGFNSTSERYLAWLLLLAVGVSAIWAAIFHIFFPSIASAQIGWSVSPFEFEVGVADLALGIIAVIAFWRSLSFQSAVATYALVFYVGVIFGHLYQAYAHANFSPDNFGVLLLVTVLRAALLGWLLHAAWRHRNATRMTMPSATAAQTGLRPDTR